MSLYNYKVGDCLTISAKYNVFTINIEILEIKENYIRVKDLSNEYSINGYDFEEIYLKIKFHDGSFKEIKDYGFQGTFGLNSVYSKLIKIATETDWK